MHILKAFVVAFSMYSKIPMPKVAWEEKNIRYAMCFFPFVGMVIGAMFYGWWMLCNYLQMGMLCRSAVAAVLPVLLTGGIHIDGFMDTMDAKSSYQSRERKLEILKDAHVGSFAVLSVVVYFLLEVAGFSELHSKEAAGVAALGYILSRTFSGFALVTMEGARQDGLLYTFSSGAHKRIVRVVLVFIACLTVSAMFFIDIVRGALVLAGVLLVFFYYAIMSRKEFGGITGDLAGWFLTVCELCILWMVVLGEYL